MADNRKFTQLQSLLKGLQQGATFGFGDEIAGATQTLADTLTGTSDVNKRLIEQGFKGDIGPTSATDVYKQGRNEARQDYSRAQSDNPKSYMGGEVLGTGLTAALPGPTVLKAKDALTGAVTGAGYGGLTGLGNSNREDLAGIAKDTATGALIGGTVGAIVPAAKDVVKDTIQKRGNLGGSGFFDRLKTQMKQQENAKLSENTKKFIESYKDKQMQNETTGADRLLHPKDAEYQKFLDVSDDEALKKEIAKLSGSSDEITQIVKKKNGK